MQDDLITTENISGPLLQSLFEDAYMDAQLDDDGEILVKDDVWVRSINDKKDKICLDGVPVHR